jgi:hypothetical protein
MADPQIDLVKSETLNLQDVALGPLKVFLTLCHPLEMNYHPLH